MRDRSATPELLQSTVVLELLANDTAVEACGIGACMTERSNEAKLTRTSALRVEQHALSYVSVATRSASCDEANVSTIICSIDARFVTERRGLLTTASVRSGFELRESVTAKHFNATRTLTIE